MYRYLPPTKIHKQVAASGSKWQQAAASGSKWQQVAASGSKWQQVAASGSKWQQVAASGSKWQQVAASGRLLLRDFAKRHVNRTTHHGNAVMTVKVIKPNKAGRQKYRVNSVASSKPVCTTRSTVLYLFCTYETTLFL